MDPPSIFVRKEEKGWGKKQVMMPVVAASMVYFSLQF